MQTLDQYELNSFTDYSGSYTDYIFNDGTVLNQTRRLAALKTGEVFASQSWVDVSTFEDVFSRTLYSEGSAVGSGDNKFVKFLCSEEIISDSILPRPVDISILNGAKPIEGLGKEELDRTNTFDPNKIFDAPMTPRKFKIVLGNASAFLTASADSANVISDNSWHLLYPFEIRYRDLERLALPSFNKRFYVTHSGSLKIDPTSQNPANTSLTPVSAGISNDPFYANTYSLQWLYRTQIGISGLGMYFINLLDRSITYRDDLGGENVTGSQYPRIQRLNEAYFGFCKQKAHHSSDQSGFLTNMERLNNPGKFPVPVYLNQGPDEVFGYGRSTYIASWHFKLTGWKYGVYSAMPQRTKCVFRRGRFGQPRDMLEQRLTTKFFDVRKRSYLQSPVLTTFVSGSAASVTASNPSSLNTRDTGIYDFESRSGRPFYE